MYSPTEGRAQPRADASPDIVGPGMSASLTYEPFYGLREKAFSLSADPRFLFRSPAHGPAFDEILAGIRRREGLIVLTGEIGTGKTTLCRSVLQHLDRRTFAAFVIDPFVSREDLLKTLLVDFGVISISDLTGGRFSGASRSDLSYLLYEFLDSLVPLQAFAVLIIDEAQNLSLPLLEEIRILSELERREKLLQVVLVGQPELRANLKLPQMRQVDQRVSVRCELHALDADGVAGYVNHRLLVAGRSAHPVEFTSAALNAVYQGSSGVPRLINRICDRALQHAYRSRSLQMETRFVHAALDDCGLGDRPVPEMHAASDDPSHADRQSSTPPVIPFPAPAAVTVGDASGDPWGIAFEAAPELAAARPSPARRKEFRPRAAGHRRIAWAAAAVLAASAGVGTVGWYALGQGLYAEAVPPPSTETAAASATIPARKVEASIPQSAALVEAEHASPGAPASTGTTASLNAAAAVTVPGAHGSYTILVASLKSAERAERVLEELANAGFGAHAVERDAGPAHGRFILVMVSGYRSATDVQHDLQQIRALPGGYTDARIVEQE